MSAPTLVASWISTLTSNSNTTSLTVTSPTMTWSTGDVFVAMWLDEGNTTAETTFTATNTGTGLPTWTLQQSNIAASNCGAGLLTTVATASGTGTITVGASFSSPLTTSGYGVVYQYSGSAGVGTSGKTVSASGGSSVVSLTPLGGADSAFVWLVGDWNGGALGSYTPTPSSHTASAPGPSATPADSTNTGSFDSYFACLDDQVSTGAVNYGITSGSGGPYTVLAVEVKGSASGPVSASAAGQTSVGVADYPNVGVAAIGAGPNLTIVAYDW